MFTFLRINLWNLLKQLVRRGCAVCRPAGAILAKIALSAGAHGSRTVFQMAEYVDVKLAEAIICDMCTYAYPDEDCPQKCDWMELLKSAIKRDGE